jgi:hypothetical protein
MLIGKSHDINHRTCAKRLKAELCGYRRHLLQGIFLGYYLARTWHGARLGRFDEATCGKALALGWGHLMCHQLSNAPKRWFQGKKCAQVHISYTSRRFVALQVLTLIGPC